MHAGADAARGRGPDRPAIDDGARCRADHRAPYPATLDRVERFATAGAVTAYVGLVPREYSTGEHQRRGAITKTGPRVLRVLLVQAGWVIWRARGGSAALHAWVHCLGFCSRCGGMMPTTSPFAPRPKGRWMAQPSDGVVSAVPLPDR